MVTSCQRLMGRVHWGGGYLTVSVRARCHTVLVPPAATGWHFSVIPEWPKTTHRLSWWSLINLYSWKTLKRTEWSSGRLQEPGKNDAPIKHICSRYKRTVADQQDCYSHSLSTPTPAIRTWGALPRCRPCSSSCFFKRQSWMEKAKGIPTELVPWESRYIQP